LQQVIEADIGLTKRTRLQRTETNTSLMKEVFNDVMDCHEVHRSHGHRVEVDDGNIIVLLCDMSDDNPPHHWSTVHHSSLRPKRHERFRIN
jgi:hypothetical protein